MGPLCWGCLYGRWRNWWKGAYLACSHFLPSILAMPLNKGLSPTAPRLFCSLCLHPKYNNFRSRLNSFLLLDGLTLPTTNINTVLKVLQMKREQEKAETEDHNMDTRASAINQDGNMADKVGQAPVGNVDNVLKVLVHNATEEFGFAPHDVYNRVLYLPQTREKHATGIGSLNYDELKSLIQSFVKNCELSDHSHHVVTMHPCKFILSMDHWAIEFKSFWIGKKVMESISLEEDKCLWDMYKFFHKTPEASSLAGRFFEEIVHCLLSNGWQSDKPTPQPIHMANGHDPPPFPQIPLPHPLSLTPCWHLSCQYASAQGLSCESTSPMGSVM